MLSILKVFKRNVIPREEVEATIRLSPEERYSTFIKKVTQRGDVWILCGRGWIENSERKKRFPLWPGCAYAALCAEGTQAGYRPQSLKLQGFVDSLLAVLCKDGMQMSIFDTPHNKGLAVDEKRFREDLALIIR